MKRPILYWVILFILGEVLYKIFSIYVVGFLGIIFLVYLMRNRRPGKKWVLQLVGGVCFFLGVFCMHSWKQIIASCDVADGTQVRFEGKVLKKEETASSTSYIIDVKAWNDDDVAMKIQVYLQDDDAVMLGSYVIGFGNVKSFSTASNPGGYDEKSYKYGNGIVLALEKVEITSIETAIVPWRECLAQVQSRLEEVYNQLFQEAHASLAIAMTLGDKKNLDADMKALYQRNGIAHLIAISGLHIAMIGGSLYKLLRRLTGSYPLAATVGVLFICAYGVMTGLSGATYRAVIMLVTSMGADVFGRRYDGLTAISLALLIMLVQNPYQFTQVGFLLSFGAVLGIVLIQPIWKQRFPKLPRCLDGLCVSISVQMVLTPIMLWFFYEMPVYGIFLNVLVVPLMNILLAMLIFSGVLGLFSVELALVPSFIAECIFSIYETLCKAAENLPGHILCTGRPAWWWMVLYYVLLALGVWLAYRTCWKKSMVALGTLLLMFCTFLIPSKVNICMLDVGQGDSIYIRTKHHRNILVDGGSSTERNIGQYVLKNGLKYYGGSELDYVFVTHSDSDHYSGIQELLEENLVTIRNIVFPAITNPDESYRALVELAQSNGCNVYYMKKGDCLQLDGVQLQCLNPQPKAYEDKNAGSIVLQMTYGNLNVLLTGDLNQEEEMNLLKDLNGSIDVLKVAHHGSATSTSDALLKKIRPLVACISVGEDNMYGHPAREVMERLSQVVSKIYLTKDSGAITIETDGKTYWIDEYRIRE